MFQRIREMFRRPSRGLLADAHRPTVAKTEILPGVVKGTPGRILCIEIVKELELGGRAS